MSTLAHTYADSRELDITRDLRERTGGPLGPRKTGTKRADFYERFAANSASGSHMPLDIEMHWDWRNPLNIIPAFVLLVVIITVVALIVG